MKVELSLNTSCLHNLPNDDIAYETPRDSLVLSCNAVVQKLEVGDKSIWSDLNKLVVKAQDIDYLAPYVEELKQIIINNHVKNATSTSQGISLEERIKITDVVHTIEQITMERQIMSLSSSFSFRGKSSALDSLTLTPESTVSKFFDCISSLNSAVLIKDKKRATSCMEELHSITYQICVMYGSTHPNLTNEFSRVKTLLSTNLRLYLEHESSKNAAKFKESKDLMEKLLKTLITTSDETQIKNDAIKLDDFPTVKYHTDQLKERIIRIENQDFSRSLDTNGNKIPEDTPEYWKSLFFSSQTKYNTLKLYVDDMIFSLGFT